MMNFFKSWFERFLVPFLIVSRVAALPLVNSRFSWDNTKFILAFGDSYSYVQGTAGYPGYNFLGSYLPGDFAYTPEELLNDKIVQNFSGTAEGGPNWLEFISGCAVSNGEWKPQSCKIQLWDFAFGGADVSEEFTPLHHNFTIPLVNQTQQYLLYGDHVLKKKVGLKPAKTLVTIWIGINDFNDSYNYNETSFPAFYDSIISTKFSQSVAQLYRAGYRHFLFPNLPPLDRTPNRVNTSISAPYKARINQWNSILRNHVDSFGRQNPDSTSMFFNANSFFNGVLDNPSAYGISNTTGYCSAYLNPDVLVNPGAYGCLPLDEYFWYNLGHTTSHTHKLLSVPLLKFLRAKSKP